MERPDGLGYICILCNDENTKIYYISDISTIHRVSEKVDTIFLEIY